MSVRRSRPQRNAFTLVELLVVILIIAILVSLVSSAVMMALARIPQINTSTEIAQLTVALEAFMTDYNLTDPPPSFLVLNESTPLLPSPLDGGRTSAFLQKCFGKTLGSLGPIDWNGDGILGNGPWTLEGEQCLIFYIGGIPTSPGLGTWAPQGFSANNMNPSIPASAPGRRKGPYYNFQPTRLVPLTLWSATASPFPVYIDPWQSKTANKPYAYFSSNGQTSAFNPALGSFSGYYLNTAPSPIPLDCTSIGALPYWTAGTTPQQFANPNTFQIVSAGKDGMFGVAGWIPSSGVPPIPPSVADAAGKPSGADDQANFTAGLVGQGQQ